MMVDNMDKAGRTFELLKILRQHTTDLRTELGNMSHSFATSKSVDASEALAALIAIKVLNREAQMLAESCQGDVVPFRDAAERKRVELANLAYEREMVRNEIAESRQQMEREGLESVVVMLQKEACDTPEVVRSPRKRRKTKKSKKEVKAQDDENARINEDLRVKGHEKMLMKLTAELEKRKRAIEDVKSLQKRKTELETGIKTGKTLLRDVPSKVEKISAAVNSLRAFFATDEPALAIDLSKEELGMFKSLPSPLYVLATEAYAYRSAFGTLDVDIEKSRTEVDFTANPETATEKELHRSHPLSVSLTMGAADGSENSTNTPKLKVYYFPHLHIVSCLLVGQWLDSRALVNLFPHDSGQVSPNPANSYLLSGNFRFKPGLANGSYPFLWANIMCGLHYTQLDSKADHPDIGWKWCRQAATTPGHIRFSTIIDAVRKRLRATEELRKELRCISRNDVIEASREAGMESAPSTQIKTWRECHSIGELKLDGVSQAYEIEFINGQYGLSGLVCLRCEHPQATPCIKLRPSETADCPPKMNELRIRSLEKEVALIRGVPHLLLSQQLLHIMAEFDAASRDASDNAGLGTRTSPRRPRKKKGKRH